MARKIYLTTKDVGERTRLTPAGVRRLVRAKQLLPDAATKGGAALFEPTTIARFARRRAAGAA